MSDLRLLCPIHSRPGREVMEDVIGRQGDEYVLACGTVRPGLLPGLEQRIFIELVFRLEESAPALAGKVAAIIADLDSVEKASSLTTVEASCVAGTLLGVEELRRHLPQVSQFLSAVVQHTGASA